MAKYIVKWNYASSYGGPWKKGDEIDLGDGDAEEINRDSPGVLVKKPAPRKAKPQKDRQLKRAPADRSVKDG